MAEFGRRTDRLPATCIHPLAVAIPIAGYAWLILTSWLAFASGETSLVLTIVTFLGVMFFGLLLGGGALARNMALERETRRSFRGVLDGDADLATARIGGRGALAQIAAMPLALRIGGTLIILVAVLTSA